MITQPCKQEGKSRSTDLPDIHEQLLNQIIRMAETISRVENIGNRLADESQCVSCAEESKDKPNRLPGIIDNLYTDVESFSSLNYKLETAVSKIDKYI